MATQVIPFGDYDPAFDEQAELERIEDEVLDDIERPGPVKDDFDDSVKQWMEDDGFYMDPETYAENYHRARDKAENYWLKNEIEERYNNAKSDANEAYNSRRGVNYDDF